MEETLTLRLHESDVEEELCKMLEENGEEYRQITSPIDIEILTEEREIPASTTDLYYSDGTAPNRIVPAGTILVLPNKVITEEQLANNYEPYLDEKGNVTPGKYTRKIIVKAMQNPFGKNIERVNYNGFVIGKFDSECYFLTGYGLYKVDIMSKEHFEQLYEPYKSNKKTLK